MANMVDSLGAQFFGEKFHQALFLHDNRTYEIMGVGNGKKISCMDTVDGNVKELPFDFFSGFKVFAYPRLGWRRFGKNHVAYCTKIQSAKRGLAVARVERTPSPTTNRLMELGIGDVREEHKRGDVLMNPKWDNAGHIPALLRGERTAVVLSEDVLIEPNVRGADGYFIIYHGLTPAGHYGENGNIRWVNDKFKNLIQPMLQV